MSRLSGDLFLQKLRNLRAFAGVLDRYGANISLAVEIQQCVVIEVFWFQQPRRHGNSI